MKRTTANQPLLTAGQYRSRTGMREALNHYGQLNKNEGKIFILLLALV